MQPEHQSPEAEERARRVQLVLMDVDGVLTDGSIVLLPDSAGGVQEIKIFNVHDGVGITFAHRAGLRTGILSGRTSASTAARAKELGIEIVEQGSHQKDERYAQIRERVQLPDSCIAYMGDDMQDLPILCRAGFAIAPANARKEVKAVCHFVTERPGGRGAVREALEFILHVQGKWEQVARRYEA